MTYLIETRRTVGAYKTIAAKDNLPEAQAFVEQFITEQGGEWKPYEKTDSIVLSYKCGNTHNNTIIRVRSI
jgi:hypothetical protein